MSLVLKTASFAEIPLLLGMMQEFYHEEALAFDREVIRAALEELVRSPALGEVQLLQLGAVPIGYLAVMYSFILEFGGRQAFLDELFLSEAHRGFGHAREALRLLEAHVAQRGINVVRLEVARSNARALALYERAGFERHDRFTMTKLLDRPPGSH